MKVISNCPLCEERGLHATGEGEQKVQQCINCGYVSSEKFILDSKIPLEETEQYKMLSEDMQKWMKIENGRMWIPTMMTLPIGMLYPKDENGNMKWTFCKMLDIPEEEQKNYPIPEKEGKFYKQRYDTDNPIIFKSFLEGLDHINKLFKEIQESEGVYGGREHPIPDEEEPEDENGLEYKG
tara:strand:- start:63 stop:605 length:543 start_codon:yes stop_codon:yes gene_type:complete